AARRASPSCASRRLQKKKALEPRQLHFAPALAARRAKGRNQTALHSYERRVAPHASARRARGRN
ncbi:hypothetical protein A2U01_0105990, partial [Trifolium medium]|nr:hypothetical protein [Trifolium medium]